MAFPFGRVRQIAAAGIGIGSILAGLILAFGLVTPGVVERLPTNELLGLLGLIVLPLATLWAYWADRHAAARATAATTQPVFPTQQIEAKPEMETPEPTVEVHPAGRRTVRHRRHDPARSPA